MLSLFISGYALCCSVANQPFGFPDDFIYDEDLNPDKLTQAELFENAIAEEGAHPMKMMEVLFFALFGVTDYDDVGITQYNMPWTIYLIKVSIFIIKSPSMMMS